MPKFKGRGRIELECFEPNCKYIFSFQIKDQKVEFKRWVRLFHKCYINSHPEEELEVLDLGLFDSFSMSWGFFTSDEKIDILEILKSDNGSIVNRCISEVPWASAI